MMRNLVTIVTLLAVLSGAWALTNVAPVPLPRTIEVVPPVESKLVCANMPVQGVLFFNGADEITPLGQESATAAGPTVVEGLEAPALISGGAGVTGGTSATAPAVRSHLPCSPPRSRGTIVVPGTAGTDLLIVNPDASEAVVDLTLYGIDGEIVALGARGIAVGSYSTRTIALSVLVDVDGPVGVVHRASRGRATVVARNDSPGILEAATSSSAGTEHLLTGVPAGATSASVLVTNPGNERATLQVTALGAALGYTPEGGADVTVEAYTSISVDLALSLAGEATGLRIASDVDVAVALTTAIETDPAFASPVESATELGAFAPAGGTLQVSNPGETQASVEITIDVVDSEPVTSSVVIPAGVTITMPMDASAPRGQTVNVTSDSALFGGIVNVADGATIIPLVSMEAPEVTPVDAEIVPTLR